VEVTREYIEHANVECPNCRRVTRFEWAKAADRMPPQFFKCFHHCGKTSEWGECNFVDDNGNWMKGRGRCQNETSD
jgi:hypothetical protein